MSSPVFCKWKENFIWRSTFTELSIDLQSKWVGNLRNSNFFPEQSLFSEIELEEHNISFILRKFSLLMFFVSDSKNMYIYFSFHLIFLYFPSSYFLSSTSYNSETKNIKLDVQKTQNKSKRIRIFINYKEKKRRIRDHGAN